MSNKAQTKAYFDRVAVNYLDRYYEENLEHYPNLKIRADIVHRTLIDFVSSGGKILDVGCGGGNLVVALAQQGYHAFGLDIAPSMVAAAHQLISQIDEKYVAHCEVRQGDIEALPYADATFDAAVASGVFEYLTNDRLGLGELRRVLRPGGIALLSFRNRTFSVYSANSYTLGELNENQLQPLIEAAIQGIQADKTRIVNRVPKFTQNLQKFTSTLTTQSSAEVKVEQKEDQEFWKKKMTRRQHTRLEVEATSKEAGFVLEQIFFFHFHPFPPIVRELMPSVYDALGLALESFSNTQLGDLLASGFIVMLRVPETV